MDSIDRRLQATPCLDSIAPEKSLSDSPNHSPQAEASQVAAVAVELIEILSAAVTQFDINMAIVIGPTPPGTGVMAAHFPATASKSTSPTSR